MAEVVTITHLSILCVLRFVHTERTMHWHKSCSQAVEVTEGARGDIVHMSCTTLEVPQNMVLQCKELCCCCDSCPTDRACPVTETQLQTYTSMDVHAFNISTCRSMFDRNNSILQKQILCGLLCGHAALPYRRNPPKTVSNCGADKIQLYVPAFAVRHVVAKQHPQNTDSRIAVVR